MTERPILFSGAMVRALLAGSKTQTRRAVKATSGRPIEFLGSGPAGGPDWNDPQCWGYEHHDSATFVLLQKDPADHTTAQYPCRHGQAGDRLWVRETFTKGWPLRSDGIVDQFDEDGNEKPKQVFYRATSPDLEWCDGGDDCRIPVPWRPSIHMPRAASRITLDLTSVRVERLQEITEADAIAEGIEFFNQDRECGCRNYLDLSAKDWTLTPLESFQSLWQLINGADAWAANPWVWALEFARRQ